MKVLFIGGTGRLSRDVALLAANRGYEVFLLTRGSKEREIFVDARYIMLYADICKADQIKKVIEGYHFDVIIDFLSYNTEDLKRNLGMFDGTYFQYIFISTATVYDKVSENEVIVEDSTPIGNKKWDYAWKKAECEQFLSHYFENRPEKYTVIRPYVTYSNSRVPYPIITPCNGDEYSFIRRIKMGKPIPVFNLGNTITTLTHTRDFAKGAVGLFMNPAAYGEAFHITNEFRTTWGEVLDCLGESLHKPVVKKQMTVEQISKGYPFYRSILEGDKAHNMVFDNSKIKQAVPDCDFIIRINEGIDEVVAFYDTHPEFQLVDYYWDGRIDRLCCYNGYITTLMDSSVSFKKKIHYLIGRCVLVEKAYNCFRKGMGLLGKIRRKIWNF